MINPGADVQAELGESECDREEGPYRGPQHRSCVGVNAGREVDGDHRASGIIDGLDRRPVWPGDRCGEPRPQQGIHDQIA